MERYSTSSSNWPIRSSEEASTTVTGVKMTDSKTICEMCGNEHASVHETNQIFSYSHSGKVVELSAKVDVISCEECEIEYTGEDAETARHAAICQFLGRLSPSEIKEIRKTFGLTQASLAQKLAGISLPTVKRWEAGTNIQSKANDNALRSLLNELKQANGVAQLSDFTPVFRTKIPTAIVIAEERFHLRPGKISA